MGVHFCVGTTAMNNKKILDDKLQGLSNITRLMYYADILLALQYDLSCWICLNPVDIVTDPDYKNHAVLVTRILDVRANVGTRTKVSYPAQHTILFDDTLPPVAAARLIAHEIYHIWINRPAERAWDGNIGDNAFIGYPPDVETDADKFSLLLLQSHPFKVGFTPPVSAAAFIQMLDAADPADGSGKTPAWPESKHMSRDETIAYVKTLYGK